MPTRRLYRPHRSLIFLAIACDGSEGIPGIDDDDDDDDDDDAGSTGQGRTLYERVGSGVCVSL